MLSRNAKRTILGLSVATIVVVLFAATVRHYFAARALELRLEQERASLVAPEPLLVAVQQRNAERMRTYAVRLDPFQRSRIAAEAAGRVTAVAFEVGQQVNEGDLLVQLDDTLARLNLEAARAALQSAEVQEAELQRRQREAEALAAARTIPETQLEAARSQTEVQRSEIARLRIEVERQQELLRRHAIRAPFAGTINQRLVEPGDSVNPNEPVAILASLDRLRARFSVSDLELPAFSEGQILEIDLGRGAGQGTPARVASISRAADVATGLFTIEAWVDNESLHLPAGVQGRVQAVVHRYRDFLFVPAPAVRFEGARSLVTVRVGEKNQLREVRLGPEIDGHYPVLTGLEEGEFVLVR